MVGASQPQPTSKRHRGNVLAIPVLLVNRHYAPVSIATVRRSLVLLYTGAATALDEHGDTHDFFSWRSLPVREHDDGVKIVDGSLRAPRVLHLSRYERAPRFGIRLTRRNLLLRDGHRCQYCGGEPGLRDLNVDHVLPRSRGGRDSWDNLVIACRSCNLRKGKHTPDEAGMQLLSSPVKPGWNAAAHIALTTRTPFSEWQQFLGTT